MAKSKYLTAPIPSKKMPAGIPYILTNEASERFAYYGMTSILVVFMTKYLMGSNGTLDIMAEDPAKAWFHWFTAAVYFMAVIGAVISDVWLGKFKTIIWFSALYCVGFAILAWDHTRLGLIGGLTVIAVASGIIKPCVSANVGDQFGASNKHLIEKVYRWFYFSINLGAAISMFVCPILLDKYGPKVGFGVPGIFMFVALVVYWLGRYKLVHIPPAGKTGWRETLDREGIRTLGRICIIYLFVFMFFALFYQSESAWVLQAGKMNLRWLGKDWLPAQMQSANPVLIMILIPLFSWVIYPALNRLWPLTPLRKIGIGMFLTAASFLVPVWIEIQLERGIQPSIGWQFVAYIFLTGAEVMVSITALQFAYKQAPKKMKSIIQSINLLSISLGNMFAAVVNDVITNDDGTSKLPGASYYWFFVISMVLTAAIFIPVARWYKPKEYIQDEASVESSA
ncbi:MAG: MFS transporter [Phycisphaerae bacterium]|nr:POT family MFS transporter [Phycisphaerae bacterium]NIW72603.1 MFS transporter [candidate division KSB1 bacterium]NIP51673.1 POT family MFS transporter [Phycisphaerae bacterium]NIS50842.1 POT family MFS transporter [Phycisphaerae bacterium]NIU08561.1 POT family MFS transporter [Phycisphaerae bacterium]